MTLNDFEDWIDEYHFINYHPNTDDRHFTDSFGDSMHGTGFLLLPTILRGEALSSKWQNRIINGINLRWAMFGAPYRHPNDSGDTKRSRINRDQLTPFLYVAHQVSPALAERLYLEADMFLMPYQWLHFQRSRELKVPYILRAACESMEFLALAVVIFNSLVYKPLNWLRGKIKTEWLSELIGSLYSGRNGIDSALIKKQARGKIALKEEPTFLSPVIDWLNNNLFNMPEVFKRYSTYKHGKNDKPSPWWKLWIGIHVKVKSKFGD